MFKSKISPGSKGENARNANLKPEMKMGESKTGSGKMKPKGAEGTMNRGTREGGNAEDRKNTTPAAEANPKRKEPRNVRRGRVAAERVDLLPLEEQPTFTAGDMPRRDEMMAQGRTARKLNLGRDEYDKGGFSTTKTEKSMYKGREWASAESVADQNAMMGIIPPESVVYPPKRSRMMM